MKSQKIILNCFGLFLISMLVFCKKNTVDIPIMPVYNSNISLWDKPLDTVKANIQGKWKLEYRKGGIIAGYIYYPEKPEFYTFNQNNLLWSYDGKVFANNALGWVKGVNYCPCVSSTGDNVWLMMFSDSRNTPYDHVIDNIHNDTLVFHDNGFDGVTYNCSRGK